MRDKQALAFINNDQILIETSSTEWLFEQHNSPVYALPVKAKTHLANHPITSKFAHHYLKK